MLKRGSWELIYLFIIFNFTCQHDQLGCVCSGKLQGGGGGGLRCGHSSKRGVLGASPSRKTGGGGLNSVLGAGQKQKRGAFTAAHTYTEHICESPPPPPGYNCMQILNQPAYII